MASLDNGSAHPSKCSKVECFISSFVVTITPANGSLTAVITDTCNQITECRMMNAVLSKAISEYLADEDITPTDGDCKFGCCNGLYGVSYVLATLTATYEHADITAGAPVEYEVVPPFYVST